MYKLAVTIALFFCSPAAHADKFNFAFGVGDSISNNSFVNSAYANLWSGTYDGSGPMSGFYVAGNVGASYWRSNGHGVDATGRPVERHLNHRPQFWVFSAGPTKTLSTNLTVYAGPGVGYRRSSYARSAATRFNINAGLMYQLTRESSVHVTVDSVNRGLALSFGVRLF